MTLSKWYVVVIALAALLVALYYMARETFHVETFIPARPDRVWAVLMDTQNYGMWHPLLLPVEGRLESGTKLKYQMTQPDGKQSEFVTKVLEVEPRRKLRQFAGLPLVITADHEYRLEAVEGGTLLIQHEVDNGFGMFFWDSSWVQPTYEQVNEALKRRVLELNGNE